jgi:hypothetical protein
LEDWVGITDGQNKDDKEIGLEEGATLNQEKVLGGLYN